jgi:hypothetical protein
MRHLVQEAEHALEEAVRIGAARGFLAGPLPWWVEWQRRHEAASTAAATQRIAGEKRLPVASKPTDETPLTQAERHFREGQARVVRQQALLARVSTQDPTLQGEAEILLHSLMRAQMLVKVRLQMLQRFKR